ncbi:hypothetical protein GGQ80_003229 [Sphingomonas jinjuensis]|uniref:Uncharacterized protein n=1 Tax=Sphingomonas jinjuensis TaxID=535907 RepID=A0A840FCE9_9SPHN|nr:hypothetical protein [Sphingomonas jinjuensis]MBB4155309.1 hypothetical protein [Sphingomonas jinjuensis]
MRTGWAIIIAAIIVGLSGVVGARQYRPDYSLTNLGAGATMRLDNRSGDMIGCVRFACRDVVRNGRPLPAPTFSAREQGLPPLPPGSRLVQ